MLDMRAEDTGGHGPVPVVVVIQVCVPSRDRLLCSHLRCPGLLARLGCQTAGSGQWCMWLAWPLPWGYTVSVDDIASFSGMDVFNALRSSEMDNRGRHGLLSRAFEGIEHCGGSLHFHFQPAA